MAVLDVEVVKWSGCGLQQMVWMISLIALCVYIYCLDLSDDLLCLYWSDIIRLYSNLIFCGL
jgi:hypothetical protein